MKQVLSTLILNRCRAAIFYETKRFAGHNKWSNIRHGKALQDQQRNARFINLKMKMRIAIAEGGSFKPEINSQLRQVIDQAKKENMPLASINKFLSKCDPNNQKREDDIVDVRGPGWMMLVHVSTTSTDMTKTNIRNKLRKYGGKIVDRSMRNAFEHICVAIVEKDRDINKAMEDAINIGVEDVEETQEDNKSHFVFKLNPLHVNRVTGELNKLNYTITAVEDEWIPKTPVELDENIAKEVEQLREKLLSIPEVESISDNVA